MTKITTILVAATLLILAATPGRAQTVTRTWVSSSTGNDSGTCQFTSPCKTFAYAYTQTSPKGEMLVKDSGSYGQVSIAKAITIAADGVVASIGVPSGGTGITVTAGTNDVVILRGLTIDGHGAGLNGIEATQALQLVVQDSFLQGMSGNGLVTDGSGGQFALPSLTISNVTATNNGTGINNSHAYTNISIVNSHFIHNYVGLNPGEGDIKNSFFSFNINYGINAVADGCLTIGGTTLFFDKLSKFSSCSGSYGDNYFRELNGVDAAPPTLSKN